MAACTGSKCAGKIDMPNIVKNNTFITVTKMDEKWVILFYLSQLCYEITILIVGKNSSDATKNSSHISVFIGTIYTCAPTPI